MLSIKKDFKVGAVYKLPKGICGDIDNKTVLLEENAEIEFVGVDNEDLVFKIIKPARLKGKTLLVLAISALSALFEEAVDEKGNTVFKPGDKVELFRSNAGNKVGRVFTFVDYLPEAVGNLDCVCKTAEGASTFGISKNLRLVAEKEPIRKKIGQADLLRHLFNDKSYVDVYRNGNKTIALYFEYDEEGKKNVYEGIARCNPNDKFDPLFGVALAVARAMGDEDKEELLLNEGLIA